MKIHPFAEIFPLMNEAGIQELADDIGKHGLRLPITRYQGAILDGRNRFTACELAKVEPVFIEYKGATNDVDLMAFVVSMNLPRRHLTPSQLAMVAAKMANMGEGGNKKSHHSANLPSGEPLISQAKAADLVNVSNRTVGTAKKVIEKATPSLLDAVESGEVTVSAAAEVADLPKAEQKKIVAAGPKAVKDKAAELRKAKKPAPPKTESEVTGELPVVAGATAPVPDAEVEKSRKPYPVPTKDKDGIPIQEWAVEAFGTVPEFRDLIRIVKDIRSRVSDLADEPGGVYLQRRCNWTTLGKNDDGSERGAWRNATLDTLLMLLEDTMPLHTDCPYAFNPFKEHEENCNCCKGLRWTPKQNTKNTPRECTAALFANYGIEGKQC